MEVISGPLNVTVKGTVGRTGRDVVREKVEGRLGVGSDTPTLLPNARTPRPGWGGGALTLSDAGRG